MKILAKITDVIANKESRVTVCGTKMFIGVKGLTSGNIENAGSSVELVKRAAGFLKVGFCKNFRRFIFEYIGNDEVA